MSEATRSFYYNILDEIYNELMRAGYSSDEAKKWMSRMPLHDSMKSKEKLRMILREAKKEHKVYEARPLPKKKLYRSGD